MPGRDDYRSNREHEEYERRRREMDRDPQRRMGGGERRSFEPRGRFSSDEARYGAQNQRGRLGDYPGVTGDAEAWRAERAGGRYDQDRGGYGRAGDEAWRQEGPPSRDDREAWRTRRPDEFGYGGQEYGIEAHGSEFTRSSPLVQRAANGGGGRRLEERFGQDDRGDPPFGNEPRQAGQVAWRDDGAPYGDSHLDRQDRGMKEFGVPHDYGFHPQDQEFEPHYTHWRDEQMRRHDEEYHRWRTQQLRQYDDDYKAWRGERRQAFGETFSQWRSGRSAQAQPLSDAGAAPGSGGEAGGADRPTVRPESETRSTGGQGDRTGGGPGFAQASPAVQKATDGAENRATADKDETDGKDRS